MSLGWAIAGIGSHADLKIAPAIARARDSRLVAVYSRDRGRADAFAEKRGANAAYSSLDAMLADSRVDAVFVASPNHLHAPQTIKAAAAGKHVLAEKPMANSVSAAAAMIDACRDHGVTLGLGFELRFHPAHLWARRLIDAGAIGRIRLAHGQWGRGNRGEPEHLPRTGLREWWETPELIGEASVLVGLGVHVFDLLRFLLREEVVEVVAMTDGQTDAQPLETHRHHSPPHEQRRHCASYVRADAPRYAERPGPLRLRRAHRHQGDRLGGTLGPRRSGQRNGKSSRVLRI